MSPPAIQHSLFSTPVPRDPWERHRRIRTSAARLRYLAEQRGRTTDLDGLVKTPLGWISGRLALDHIAKRDPARIGPDAGAQDDPDAELKTLAVWAKAVRDVLLAASPDKRLLDPLVERATAILACAEKIQWSAAP